MYYILLYFLGMIIGIFFHILFEKMTRSYGIIEVDHKKETCNVHLSNDDLLNKHKTNILVKIKHIL